MGFCGQTAEMLEVVGWILTIFKIAIPILIIALGMFDFGKAVVSSDDDEIKKQATTLGRRAIAGLIIFFIPTIVIWIFTSLTNYNVLGAKDDFEICKTCILKPWDDGCVSTAEDPIK